MPYEILDHTADIKLRVTAPTREELFDQARLALYSVVGDLAPQSTEQAESDRRTIVVQGGDPAEVMHDWLAELLSLFDSAGRLCEPVGPYEIDDQRLRVDVRTVPVDLEASRFDREVKAVTYHDLLVDRQQDQWVATVILDI